MIRKIWDYPENLLVKGKLRTSKPFMFTVLLLMLVITSLQLWQLVSTKAYVFNETIFIPTVLFLAWIIIDTAHGAILDEGKEIILTSVRAGIILLAVILVSIMPSSNIYVIPKFALSALSLFLIFKVSKSNKASNKKEITR